MKSNVRHGKLRQEPKSLREARARRAELKKAIERTREQLSDPTSFERRMKLDEFDRWKASARTSLTVNSLEMKLYDEWIAREETTVEGLLHETLLLLQQLQRDEVEFDPDEADLVQRVGNYFQQPGTVRERGQTT